MDYELRFIASLLHAPRNDQQDFYSKQIPKGVFKIREKEIKWVYDFRIKYGQYPSAAAFKEKFDEQLKIPKDPMAAALQPVLDRAMYDQMVRVQEQTKEMLDEGVSLQETMGFWRDSASKVSSFDYDSVDVNLETSTGAETNYRERVKSRQGKGFLFESPWGSMNHLVKFFLPKELYTLVSRSSIGKTWMVLWIGHFFAMMGIKVLLISKEMGTEVLEGRLECIRFKLPYSAFRSGELPPRILRRWRREKRFFKKSGQPYPFILSGKETYEGVGFEHIISSYEKYKPQVVIVDGAYLLYPSGLPKNANDTQRFTFISNRSKVLAKATNTFWINVLQQGRKAEDKEGMTKGGVTTIFGADAWYQDSDWVHDISGKRGTDYREHTLLKGRESGLGGFPTKFVLDPYPNFEEIKGTIVAMDNKSIVKFKGIG